MNRKTKTRIWGKQVKETIIKRKLREIELIKLNENHPYYIKSPHLLDFYYGKKQCDRLNFTISDYKSRENSFEIKIHKLELEIKYLKNRNLFERIFNL